MNGDNFEIILFNKDEIINYFKENKNIVIVKNDLIEYRYNFNQHSIMCSYWDEDLKFNKHKYLYLDINDYNLYLRKLKLIKLKQNIKWK